MVYIVNGYASQNSFIQGSDDFFVVFDGGNGNSSQRAAVFFRNGDVIGNVYQTTGQITGICRLQSRIRQTFTGTVGGDEVLQYGQALFEVCQNRVLDNLTACRSGFLGFCHQSTHTAQLADLFAGTTGSGIKHHVDGVEALVVFRQLLHQRVGQFRIDMRPDIDDLVVTFVVGDESHIVVCHHLFYLVVSFL